MDQHTLFNAFVVLPLVGYLTGAIPFGFLIGKIHGVDVREHGSGNIGATNVGRVLGRQWGILCFFIDVGKGLLPTLYAGHYLRTVLEVAPGSPMLFSGQMAWLLVAACCVLGHMFSVYLKFTGGKGVATSLGVVLGIWPYFTMTGVLVFAVWVAMWGTWRYVSLASIGAAVAFPVGLALLTWRIPAWHFGELVPLFVFSGLMALLVIVRHRTNIKRLLAGTESRGGKSAPARPEAK
ncbi:MAG: glycerol-3-phosphate 1-O-acyltransferase PlsY [Phycisphaerae bacterium]|nr:glycerol-3-phosphate 1-O-acyltransferase PlsY [Phycisphaerae bacterium]